MAINIKVCNDGLSKIFGKAITAISETRITNTKDEKGKKSTKKHVLYALVTPKGKYITKGVMWKGLLNDQLFAKVVETICKCDRWKAHDCAWLAKRGYVKRLIDEINAPKPDKAKPAKTKDDKAKPGKTKSDKEEIENNNE